MDLAIPAGALVAITGPSGAGKTTFADVLLGLLPPRAGEVLVDGALLAGGNLRRWRRAVGYAPQEPYLSHDTIRANLLWVRPDAPEADLWRALRLAAADRFVAALPHGLDTVPGTAARGSPAANTSGWRSHGRSSGTRRCWCSTRRPVSLTPVRSARSWRACGPWPDEPRWWR